MSGTARPRLRCWLLTRRCSRLSDEFKTQYAGWTWLVLQLVPVLNIALALLPLLRKKDDIEDIPLTPAQRRLLGLPPSSNPATPGSKFSTPPRYSRTPSISASVGSNRSYASSPLSGKGSPATGARLSGSPYSPAGSPLLQKAISGGVSVARRSSFGASRPARPACRGRRPLRRRASDTEPNVGGSGQASGSTASGCTRRAGGARAARGCTRRWHRWMYLYTSSGAS